MTEMHSTTPRFTGKNARDNYLEWLLEDARLRFQEAAAAMPIDTADLYVAFVADAEAAYRQIAKLHPMHLAMQAIAMAAYLNDILGKNYQSEDILSRWQTALTRRALLPTA